MWRKTNLKNSSGGDSHHSELTRGKKMRRDFAFFPLAPWIRYIKNYENQIFLLWIFSSLYVRQYEYLKFICHELFFKINRLQRTGIMRVIIVKKIVEQSDSPPHELFNNLSFSNLWKMAQRHQHTQKQVNTNQTLIA